MYIKYFKGGFVMLAIRISEEIERRLQELATKTGRTKTYYARKAILDFLEDMEDTYLALERLETSEKIWTQEELEADIDLAH
jgi:RHH-type rel operon transcriptional repressor/antitoxin RelB